MDRSDGAGRESAIIDGVSDANLLTLIRNKFHSLSKSHQRVAEMVLADPEAVLQSNVEDLAERAGVAKPTVVRFARSIGCEGLKDFKLKLAANLALGANYLHRAVRPNDSTLEVINNVVGSTQSAIAKWHRGLVANELAEAAAMISKARRIDCYGTGQTSHFIAQDLHARLFRMGMQSTVFTDVYLRLVSAAALGPEDVAIAISYVGLLPDMLETIAVAKQRGAKVIAITRSDAPLARMADVVIGVDVPADAAMPVGTDAYITQLLAVEMLSILVGRLRGADTIRRLEATHKLLHEKDRGHDAAATVYWQWKPPPN